MRNCSLAIVLCLFVKTPPSSYALSNGHTSGLLNFSASTTFTDTLKELNLESGLFLATISRAIMLCPDI